jgi:hypothetical protein
MNFKRLRLINMNSEIYNETLSLELKIMEIFKVEYSREVAEF